MPRFGSIDLQTQAKYRGIEDEVDADDVKHGQTLNHIACEDRLPRSDDTSSAANWQGQVALMTLKGDVDNLGIIFQQGLQSPTFAKMAALSRQMNAFFAVYPLTLCAREFPNTYTVFAGGGDLFHRPLAQHATTGRAHGPGLWRLCGWQPGYHVFCRHVHDQRRGCPCTPWPPKPRRRSTPPRPATTLTQRARKNAVVLYGERVRWPEWKAIAYAQQQLDDVREAYNLSTSYVYSLLHLIDLKEDTRNPEHPMCGAAALPTARAAVWTSLGDRDPLARAQAQNPPGTGAGRAGPGAPGSKFRIPLFNHFYRQR